MNFSQGPSSTLLVAEDDPALADVLRLAFDRGGFRVRVVRNGAEALEVARQTPFDVVCSDYQMPGLNGEQLLSGVRSAGASRDAVCVLCSAKSYELDCERLTEQLGLQAVFYKPFSLVEIVESVRAGLQQRTAV